MNWSFPNCDSHFVSQVTETNRLRSEFVEIMCYSTGQKPTEKQPQWAETWAFLCTLDHETNTIQKSTTDLWKMEEINLLGNSGIKLTLQVNVNRLFCPRAKSCISFSIYFMLSFVRSCYKTTTADPNYQLMTI